MRLDDGAVRRPVPEAGAPATRLVCWNAIRILSRSRLVVSEKTVDHHVSAILRKLDVRRRGEAVAQAARLGLTGPR